MKICYTSCYEHLYDAININTHLSIKALQHCLSFSWLNHPLHTKVITSKHWGVAADVNVVISCLVLSDTEHLTILASVNASGSLIYSWSCSWAIFVVLLWESAVMAKGTSMLGISSSTTSQRCCIRMRSGDCWGHLSTVNSLIHLRNQFDRFAFCNISRSSAVSSHQKMVVIKVWTCINSHTRCLCSV